MTPSASTHPYKHHRFPGEMISYAVWLYVRWSSRAQARTTVGREFPLSALSMAERVPSPAIAHVSCALSKIPHSSGFLRNKNAALPARAQKSPWTLSGLKKHGSRLAPAATNFRAPSECHGCRRTG
jgi:hypothetical protein